MRCGNSKVCNTYICVFCDTNFQVTFAWSYQPSPAIVIAFAIVPSTATASTFPSTKYPASGLYMLFQCSSRSASSNRTPLALSLSSLAGARNMKNTDTVRQTTVPKSVKHFSSVFFQSIVLCTGPLAPVRCDFYFVFLVYCVIKTNDGGKYITLRKRNNFSRTHPKTPAEYIQTHHHTHRTETSLSKQDEQKFIQDEVLSESGWVVHSSA